MSIIYNMEYKFNTKFKVGEILYTLIDKKIKEVKIEKIETIITITNSNNLLITTKYSLQLNDYTYGYLGYCLEENLYKTKEELINSL